MQTTEQGADAGGSAHLFAYTVREFDTPDGKKARAWTRIGVAFPHKGESHCDERRSMGKCD